MDIDAGKTIKLSEISMNDFEFLKNLYQDKDIAETALAVDFKIKDINITRTINKFIHSDDFLFVIKYRDQEAGIVTLYDLSYDEKSVKFGIILSKKFQNTHIGMFVFKAVKNFVFHELDFNKMYCEIISLNIKAMNMAEKLGFKLIDVQEKTVQKEKQMHDLNIYVLKSN